MRLSVDLCWINLQHSVPEREREIPCNPLQISCVSMSKFSPKLSEISKSSFHGKRM